MSVGFQPSRPHERSSTSRADLLAPSVSRAIRTLGYAWSQSGSGQVNPERDYRLMSRIIGSYP
jgi:hypothetical protein